MTTGSEDNGQPSEVAVNAYRIDQLEKQLAELKANTATLNLEQIKQMGIWLGLPVAVATGVFGLALWQTIETGTTSAAERRASETVEELTSEIETLQTRIQDLQSRSEETYERLIDTRARADVSAEAARRQADQAEARATDAARALAQLQRTAASASDIQQALGDVDDIAERIAGNTEFQEIVSETALTGLAGLVAAFDQSEGCPAGWSEFEEAAGRMIIGTGLGSIDRIGDQDIPLTERRWREFGGAETHVLAPEEMPGHTHSAEFALSGRELQWIGQSPSHPIPTVDGPEDSRFDWRQGGGRPHNNMPPFIALYFCEKDS